MHLHFSKDGDLSLKHAGEFNCMYKIILLCVCIGLCKSLSYVGSPELWIFSSHL